MFLFAAPNPLEVPAELVVRKANVAIGGAQEEGTDERCRRFGVSWEADVAPKRALCPDCWHKNSWCRNAALFACNDKRERAGLVTRIQS